MTEVRVTQDFRASADEVWQRIRNFAGLGDWIPGLKCEAVDGGKTRKVSLPTGEVVIESLELHDDANRTYGYTIVQGPQPVKDYHSTIKVEPKGTGSTVTWVGRFEPVGPEAVSKTLIEGIYRSCLGALALSVGG